jgi:hypothetical protein
MIMGRYPCMGGGGGTPALRRVAGPRLRWPRQRGGVALIVLSGQAEVPAKAKKPKSTGEPQFFWLGGSKQEVGK